MIYLTKNWRLNNQFDVFNVTLEKYMLKTKKQSGDKYYEWDNKGYFSNVKAALQSWIHDYTKDSEDFQDLIVRIENLESIIEKAFKLRMEDDDEAEDFQQKEKTQDQSFKRKS